MSEENYMRIIDLRGKKLTRAEMLEAMPRAEMGTNEATELVQPILDDVKARGAAAPARLRGEVRPYPSRASACRSRP